MIPESKALAALRTDTPDEQRAHYPHVSARRGYRPWDDRAAWTAKRHQVNEITVENVRNSVSITAADYATAAEIAAAVAELNAAWARAGKAVRAANKAAEAVFPQGWTCADPVARFDAYEALTAEDRALVDSARELRDARHELRKVAKRLERLGMVERRKAWRSVDLIGDSCPTFTAIAARIAAAGEKAAAEYVARIQSLPVDDAAWALELASRNEREAWFRNGPIVRREPASKEATR